MKSKNLNLLFIFLSFILVLPLISCEGKSREKVNQLIKQGDFGAAYEEIDKQQGNFDTSKLNAKVLSEEIIYLIGDESLSPSIKASKIVLTIRERAKYNISGYDDSSQKDKKKAYEEEKTLLQHAITIASTSEQEELAEKLRQALDSLEKPDDPSFFNKIF